jgi:MoaA/NifB/PqqE/SkfB family radical SAM enzyme
MLAQFFWQKGMFETEMKLTRFLNFALKLPFNHFTGIVLILTRECNLNCRYCGVVRAEKRNLLEPEQWKRIIDYFRRNRHMHFIFTGGEPLLYKGLPELVRYASRHSMTCLLTNGKNLSPDVLKELSSLDSLTLSVDPENDQKTSAKHGFNCLDFLKKHADRTGLSVTVMATVTRKNVKGIPDVLKKISQYKFPLLLSLYHSGDKNYNFRTDFDDLDFRTEEDISLLEELSRRLIEMKKMGYQVAETDWYLDSMSRYKRGETVTECHAGRDWFEVDTDGIIKACHDSKPSGINALDEPDYETLKTELQKTLPENCRCIYDFYFNAQYLRKKPVRYLYHVWKSRKWISL